ncbi:hypothetical protein EP342_02655 [bacterium]|nr:MAG: hypothetical protein EP342_02655 [bacterium]
MKLRHYFFIILFSIIVTPNLSAEDVIEEKPREIGASFKLSKSLSIIPYGQVVNSSQDITRKFDLVNGTFGVAIDLMYKAKRRTYYNFVVEYNHLSLNKEELDYLKGEELSINYTSVQVSGISYVNPPDEFTPFFGYGLEFLFISSNQNNVLVIDNNYTTPQQVDFFNDFNMAILLKAGLSVPIESDITLTGDIDFHITFAEFLGLMPKLNLGATYWFK